MIYKALKACHFHVQEWKTVLEQECMESKWQAIATQCNAKRNYGLAKGVQYTRVTLKMVEDSGGIQYWDSANVVMQAPQVTDDKQNLGSHWFPFAPLDSPGLSWGSPELSWAFLDSTGFSWAPLGLRPGLI